MKQSYYSRFHPAWRLLISVTILLALLFTTPATLTRADDDGFALAFDGVNDLVELNETHLIMGGDSWTTTKTIELWVKPDGLGESCYHGDVAQCDTIFGDKPIWWGIKRGVFDGEDRIWVYNFDGNNDVVGIPYTPGVWVHIALVHNGGVLRGYKNGVEIGSVPSGATQQPITGAYPVLYLGGLIVTSLRYFPFQGQLDEVRLWTVARSQTEISNNMRALLIGSEPGLAAYYQMSDGSGINLTDDSIHSWNGTLLDGDVDVPPNGAPPLWVTSTAFDLVGPTVTINQAGGQADPTANEPITFSVVFSEDVTGFGNSPGDVDLSASTVGGTLSASVSGSDANYTVTVTGMSGSGEVIASIPAGAAQNASALGNNTSTCTDNSVTFDELSPTVTINQAGGQLDPTNTSPINFTVAFSENVTGFTSGDVSITGIAGTPTVNVTGGPATYNVAVGGMASGETVTASIAAGVAQDGAGNANTPSSSSDHQVTYDATPPTVTINQAAGQVDPTNASPINFTVTFSENVSGFTSGDVTITGIAGTPTVNVTGGPAIYNVAVGGMASGETVTASIAAGAAQDAAGNANTPSSSSDHQVTYDATPPTVTINQAAGQADPTDSQPINFTVTFSENVSGFSNSDLILTGVAGTPTVNVTGGPAIFGVSVSGLANGETVIAAVAAGAAQDAAGNASAASTSTDPEITYQFYYWVYLPLIIR